MTSALVGRWRLVRTEGPANFEHVTMDFRPDGTLEYSIELADRRQIMNPTYSISGDIIISDQPSRPGEERTRFALGADGMLELDRDGTRSWYERAK